MGEREELVAKLDHEARCLSTLFGTPVEATLPHKAARMLERQQERIDEYEAARTTQQRERL